MADTVTDTDPPTMIITIRPGVMGVSAVTAPDMAVVKMELILQHY